MLPICCLCGVRVHVQYICCVECTTVDWRREVTLCGGRCMPRLGGAARNSLGGNSLLALRSVTVLWMQVSSHRPLPDLWWMHADALMVLLTRLFGTKQRDLDRWLGGQLALGLGAG